MAAANRLYPHVSPIETEARIRIPGVSTAHGDLRADFGPEIGQAESSCGFDARSREESSPAGGVQRQTGWILLQTASFWKKERYQTILLIVSRKKLLLMSLYFFWVAKRSLQPLSSASHRNNI